MNLMVGCGRDWKPRDGWVGLDVVPPADVLGDVREIPFPDSSFTAVEAHQVMEHLPTEDTYRAWNEVWRVLEPGGRFVGDVPGADLNLGLALRDPTHRTLYVKDTFAYLLLDEGILPAEAFHAGRVARWSWDNGRQEGVWTAGTEGNGITGEWAYCWKVRAVK